MMNRALFFLFLVAGSASAATTYFPSGYEDSRARFRDLARGVAGAERGGANGSASVGALTVPSRIDSDLTIDYLYLPATRETQKIFVLTSGVHGVEAFAGSAVQALFLEKILPTVARENLGILVVHALNPYGFKYLRRVTENNVDLNRNFDVTPELFRGVSENYRRLERFLNPVGPVRLFDGNTWLRELGAVMKQVLPDVEGARAAILLGQYEYPRGIYFGGNDFEPNKALVDRLLAEKTAGYREAYLLDLHTGYGARGVQHFWGNAAPGPVAAAAEREIYAGYEIERANRNTFYKISGDFCEYFGKVFAKQVGLAMSFEYGTLDTQTLRGSVDALYRVKLENQGHQHGYADEVSAKLVKRLFVEGYFPKAAAWRASVLRQASEALPQILSRLVRYRATDGESAGSLPIRND